MFRCSAQNFLGAGEAPAGKACVPAGGYAHARIPAPKPTRKVWFLGVQLGHRFRSFLGVILPCFKLKTACFFRARVCSLIPPYIPPLGRNIFLKNCVSRFAGPFPRCRFSQKDPPIPRGGGAASLWLLRLTETASGCVLIGSNPQPVADLPKAWQRHSRARLSFRRGLPPVSMIHAKALHLNRKTVFSTLSVYKIYLASSP